MVNRNRGNYAGISRFNGAGKKWLRLRWTYSGHKRVGLSLGIPDTVVNKQQAKKIAVTIELDFATGRYDHANYNHLHYRHYGDFVKFLVSIGARPGEEFECKH